MGLRSRTRIALSPHRRDGASTANFVKARHSALSPALRVPPQGAVGEPGRQHYKMEWNLLYVDGIGLTKRKSKERRNRRAR